MKKENEKEYGIVYILTNECMPGLIKIGMTSRKEMKSRMKELYTTGVPMPFECARACKVKLEEMPKLEAALHKAFEPHRVNENREFFRISPNNVIPILNVITHLQDADVTSDVAEGLNSNLTDKDRIAVAKAKKKRPPLNFMEMNIPEGEVLTFTEDPNVHCTIYSPRTVLFNGEETYLTAITTELLHKSTAVQPTPYWTYNGKNLWDIYNETYPPMEEPKTI